MTLPPELPEKTSLRCATLINQYWFERGFIVNAQVEEELSQAYLRGGRSFYPITSNMINGWPGIVTKDKKNTEKWREWIK